MARSAGRTWGHHERRPQARIQPCGCGEADQRLLLELRAGERGTAVLHLGQVALDPEGRIVGKGDVRAPTVQVLENIRMILRANGADMEDVVSVTVYVTDIAFLDRIKDIRMQYFPSNGPASAIIEIAKLAMPELLIEIAAVAALP